MSYSFYLSIYVSVCLSVYRSIHPSTNLSIYLSIYPSTYLSIYLSIISFWLSICLSNLWLYSPLLVLDCFSVYSLSYYTVGRTPWTGHQPVARPPPIHRINAHIHPCLEWDSNPRSQCSCGRRRFMP
jgi:hypothetical protein